MRDSAVAGICNTQTTEPRAALPRRVSVPSYLSHIERLFPSVFFFKCTFPYPFEVNDIHKDQHSIEIDSVWHKKVLDPSFKKETG